MPGVHAIIVGEDIISLCVWEEGLIDEEGTHWSVFTRYIVSLKLEITHLQRGSNDGSSIEVEADRLLVKEKTSIATGYPFSLFKLWS